MWTDTKSDLSFYSREDADRNRRKSVHSTGKLNQIPLRIISVRLST